MPPRKCWITSDKLKMKTSEHLAKRLKKTFFESRFQDDGYYTRIDLRDQLSQKIHNT